MHTFGSGKPGMLEAAGHEIDTALHFDPTLRSALNLRTNLAIINWDWSAAKIQLDALLASGPHDSGALFRSGLLARALGHMDRALAYYLESLQLNPLSVLNHIQLAMLLDGMGRPTDARAAAETAIAINPNVTKAHLLIALLDLGAGNPGAASTAIEKESGDYYRLEGRAILAFAVRRIPESDAALSKLIDLYHASAAIQVAQVYAYRGERDKAFEWLDRAYVQKDPGLINVKTDPLFKSMRSDPRFSRLLRRMKLPEG